MERILVSVVDGDDPDDEDDLDEGESGWKSDRGYPELSRRDSPGEFERLGAGL